MTPVSSPLGRLRERVGFYRRRIRQGRLSEMRRQLGFVMGYARRYWRQMVFYTLLGMVGTVVGIVTSLVSKDLVDIITGYKVGELVKTFATMIGIALANIAITQVSNYYSSKISMSVDAEIKRDVFSKILVTDWQSLTEYHTGDLLSRWGTDASVVSQGALNFIPNAVINVFKFLSSLGVVCYYDWTFAVFALLGIPVSALMSRSLLARMQRNNERSAAMSAKMSGFNQETFSNIQTIKAFDLIAPYVRRLRELQGEYIGMRLDFSRMSMATNVILGVVGLAVSYSCYGWGIYRVWSGAISYGTMTMFLTLSGTLTGAANTLGSMLSSALSLSVSAGRLLDIIEMPRESFEDAPQVEAFAERHRADGVAVVAHDLEYSYANGTQVFDKASFEAHPHEVIGLVGPSGYGKTTLLRLVLALVTPQGGQVWLESAGERLEMTPAARRLMSYVPQGNTMFSGTIASNMRSVAPDATDDQIRDALRAACAWEFVRELPDGIEHDVGERGGGFSEGQSQRLAIARALLRDSPILLLDEASSALDVATERQVLRNIMGDDNPRTCIVTTHRPTVLSMCTRVYAIEDRRLRVLGAGEVDELIRAF
jgi:ATP-binding cassette subfamily B protein